MRHWGLAFLIGDWCLQQFRELPDITLLILLGIIPIALWRRNQLFFWSAGIAAGFIWAWINSYFILGARFPSEWEGTDLFLDGRIATIPRNFDRMTRFNFDVVRMSLDKSILPWRGTIRLSWYDPTLPLKVGERWQLTARLKRPYGLMNPGGFDQEGWLFRHAIQALGTVRGKFPVQRLDNGNWFYALGRARQKLAELITATRPTSPYLGILHGLAIGETSTITAEQWEVLRRTGTIHLLAISGSHIALISGFVYLIARWCWSRIGNWALWCAAPRIGAIAAIFSAFGYAALAGFPVATQRAAIMVGVAMLALIFNRILQPFLILDYAALLVLILDPFAINEPGFWLSFGAVALIFYTISQNRPRSQFLALIRIQWAITLGLMPISIYFFQQAAIYSPLANLIAIPWIELGTVPLTLAGTLFLPIIPQFSAVLFAGADLVLSGLWPILQVFEGLPGANWAPPAPPNWALITAILGVALLLSPRGIPGRWMGLIGAVPLFTTPSAQPPPGVFWVNILDVGQGLSAVVRTTHHTLVYDTGVAESGARIIAPFLRFVGRNQIDILMVSHSDSDHSGGVESLLKSMPAPLQIIGAVPNGTPCARGGAWQWDKIEFRVIHPPDKNWGGNEGSCVLRVSGPGGRLLLPGDIGATSEARLVANFPDDLPATVIVAPHHGSNGSSTRNFIAKVAPQMVIYTTGYRNRFNFPRPEVVARYNEIGAQSLDTARHGAIELHFDPQQFTAQSWRERARRYWNLRSEPRMASDPPPAVAKLRFAE